MGFSLVFLARDSGFWGRVSSFKVSGVREGELVPSDFPPGLPGPMQGMHVVGGKSFCTGRYATFYYPSLDGGGGGRTTGQVLFCLCCFYGLQ